MSLRLVPLTANDPAPSSLAAFCEARGAYVCACCDGDLRHEVVGNGKAAWDNIWCESCTQEGHSACERCLLHCDCAG